MKITYYHFRGKEAHHRIVVGWHDSLETFYAQVWDIHSTDLWSFFWAGAGRGEVGTLEELFAHVAPFGEIPDGTMRRLSDDHGRRKTSMAHPTTTLL
jgi:hypothetical protein